MAQKDAKRVKSMLAMEKARAASFCFSIVHHARHLGAGVFQGLMIQKTPTSIPSTNTNLVIPITYHLVEKG